MGTVSLRVGIFVLFIAVSPAENGTCFLVDAMLAGWVNEASVHECLAHHCSPSAVCNADYIEELNKGLLN